jgi:Ca-activated chloride channel homolog
VDEVRKIDIARTAMGDLVQNLPESSNVALRTYGRQRPDDCSDIELVTPLTPLNRGDLAAQIAAIEPINLSRTPIGSSLAQIPDDLVGATGETLVVLMSDGEENCEGDPVAVARQLHADRPNLRINVVGFNIAPELRDRLVAVASAGGGSYFDANDVTQLSAALREAIKPIYRVFDPQAITLPAGDYKVLIGTGATQIEQQIDVRGQMATVVTLSDADGQLMADVTRDWRP